MTPPITFPRAEVKSGGTLGAALICALATVMSLGLFATRSYHTDDFLFLYAGRQICAHPLDPYGFKVNMYGRENVMSDVTQNGPLTSYYIALVATCLGWSELALHLAFLVPAVAAVVGTYWLAARLCDRPMLAALATLLCPVFLVSSANVMCDTLMLAFWVWAVFLWLRGVDEGGHGRLALSGLLIAAAGVTKYFALALIPLLLAYSLLRWPRLRWRILYLLIPAVALASYDGAMRSLYGHSMLFAAGSFAVDVGAKGSYLLRGPIALSFVGGCLAGLIFFAPLLWPRRGLAVGMVAVGLTMGLFHFVGDIGFWSWPDSRSACLLILFQLALFNVAGISLLVLAVADLRRRRDAESALLFLWTAGTFLFCWLVNWTVNGRTILPMAPAVGILLARRLDYVRSSSAARPWPWEYVPLVFTGLLGLAATWADSCQGNAARLAAAEFNHRYAGQGHNVWFTGHWGFQYYMESYGFKPLGDTSAVAAGDVLILPASHDSLPAAFASWLSAAGTLEMPTCGLLATASPSVGAAFYAGLEGPLPFGFGVVPPESYRVMTLTRPTGAEAMATLRETLKNNPNDVIALSNLGAALQQSGKIDEAIDQFRQALRIKPDNAVVHYNLAIALHQSGKLAEAIDHFQQALKLQPNDAAIHINLGLALQQSGQADAAIAQFRQALKLQPYDPTIHFRCGVALEQQGKTAEAIALWRDTIRLLPNHVVALNELAWLLATCPDATLRNATEAVAVAQRAAQLSNNQQPVILDTLAAAYAEARQFPQAVETAERAAALAAARKDTALADSLRARLKLYRAGSPYRATPGSRGADKDTGSKRP
jgi:tetratricopeptide (TPR) repeat protein